VSVYGSASGILADYTAEPPPPPWFPPPPTVIEIQRERMRGVLALALVGLLAAVILSLVMATIAAALTTKEVGDLLDPIITPLVTLAGTALGFYFGRAEG
jgi:hypothetical protein